jgi:aspartyl-tRNA(Asn)/glutamyl-tRNA(Gln) amidotransferase subunit B
LAVDAETQRQIQILESGEKINRETFTFDMQNGTLISLRTKESALDYRFLPEHDLPPLRLSQDLIDSVKASMPSLGLIERRLCLIDHFGLAEEQVAKILKAEGAFSFFCSAMQDSGLKSILVYKW